MRRKGQDCRLGVAPHLLHRMRGLPWAPRPRPEAGDTVVEPYQDPRNSVENRVEDLLARLTLEDKAGLMFHDIVMMGPGGQLMGRDNPFGRPATEAAIRDMRLNHFNVAGPVESVPSLVGWHNHVQEVALDGARHPGDPIDGSETLIQ